MAPMPPMKKGVPGWAIPLIGLVPVVIGNVVGYYLTVEPWVRARRARKETRRKVRRALDAVQEYVCLLYQSLGQHGTLLFATTDRITSYNVCYTKLLRQKPRPVQRRQKDADLKAFPRFARSVHDDAPFISTARYAPSSRVIRISRSDGSPRLLSRRVTFGADSYNFV